MDHGKHTAPRHSLNDLDQNLTMDGDNEFLERFDSRGKKMRLRRGKV